MGHGYEDDAYTHTSISIEYVFKAMPLHSTQELALILILSPLKKSCRSYLIHPYHNPSNLLPSMVKGEYFILHSYQLTWLAACGSFCFVCICLNKFRIFKISIFPQPLCQFRFEKRNVFWDLVRKPLKCLISDPKWCTTDLIGG